MRIKGFQKTTLLDYPHKLAATIFLGGCNFRCPFCHNAALVTSPTSLPTLDEDTILSYLKKRIGILEGVCITGGEPTLDKNLRNLILEIKKLGYCVKLDTNGTNPTMLRELVSEQLIDYVAMDIKNSPEHYNITTGSNVSLSTIQESIHFLLNSDISYEFRTTVVKEFHTVDDIKKIGQWLHGASQYYLQSFVDSDRLICPHQFTSYEKSTLEEFRNLLIPYISKVSLRGID